MLIKSTIVNESEADVFRTIGVRELARLTGLDASYLSRVKNNKIPITLERYLALRQGMSQSLAPSVSTSRRCRCSTMHEAYKVAVAAAKRMLKGSV